MEYAQSSDPKGTLSSVGELEGTPMILDYSDLVGQLINIYQRSRKVCVVGKLSLQEAILNQMTLFKYKK